MPDTAKIRRLSVVPAANITIPGVELITRTVPTRPVGNAAWNRSGAVP